MLPEYMKVIYRELLDVHKEAEDLLEKKGKAYRSYYTKEMVHHAQLFLVSVDQHNFP